MLWGVTCDFACYILGMLRPSGSHVFSRFGSCPWGQRPSIRETGPSPPRFPVGNLVAATKTGTSVRSGVSWRSEEEIVRQKMAQRGVFGFTMDLPWFTFTGRNQIVQNTSECWFHRRWINTIIHGSGNNSWEVRFECNARSARKSYKETGWIRLNQANQPSERDNIMQMIRVNHFIFNL